MEIEAFLGSTSLAEYYAERGIQLQVERLLEIVGEALKRGWHDRGVARHEAVHPSFVMVLVIPRLGARDGDCYGYRTGIPTGISMTGTSASS